MKFCYLDESGTGGSAVATMVGVVVDAHRMHLTKGAWLELLKELEEITGNSIQEFHANTFYSGGGIWKPLTGEQRSSIMSAIIKWMDNRKHKIVYSAVEIEKHKALDSKSNLNGLNVWKTMALHCALALQRCHQAEKKNKGHTVMVFDEAVKDKVDYTGLVLSPPEWTHEYYDKKKKQEPLDQLIDVPHFVDSKRVALVQVADFYAYILRTHYELEIGSRKEKYAGEAEKVGGWAEKIEAQAIQRANIYPKRSASGAAELFKSVAPTCCL